jgi:hypothetical protein
VPLSYQAQGGNAALKRFAAQLQAVGAQVGQLERGLVILGILLSLPSTFCLPVLPAMDVVRSSIAELCSCRTHYGVFATLCVAKRMHG